MFQIQRQNNSVTQGFTLIEVLLGLMVFSIIALTLYNTFWLGLKIDRRSNEINQGYQEARLAFELISRDLENAVRYDFSASLPSAVSFEGSSTQMSFLSVSSGAISRIRYYLTVPEQSQAARMIIAQRLKQWKSTAVTSKQLPIDFMMRQEMDLAEFLAKKKDSSPGEIIAAGLQKGSLKLSYGSLKRDAQHRVLMPKQIEWMDRWKSRRLPNAVRVQITLFDQQSPKQGVVLKREVYLPEIEVADEE